MLLRVVIINIYDYHKVICDGYDMIVDGYSIYDDTYDDDI